MTHETILNAPQLTPALAQQIASETSAIVGFNIIITDAEGIVLGSGDPERVGSFHEASLEVIATRHAAAHSAEQAAALKGVKPGVTLPILLNDHAVGTVGITGSPAEVTRLGLIIERQTEILLQQASLLRTTLRRERFLEDLVRDVGSFAQDPLDERLIVERAREYNLNLSIPRVAIAVQCPSDTRETLSHSGWISTIVVLLREHFPHRQTVAVTTGSDRYMLLAPVGEDGLEGVLATCRRCADDLRSRLLGEPNIGVGSIGKNVDGLKTSYDDALDALRHGIRVRQPVVHIATMRTAQLLEGLTGRARDRFISSVAPGLLLQPDWRTLRDTIIAWCESGFSLVTSAKMLSIHRNTLVFRLEKIERLLGWTTRRNKEYLDLYLACQVDLISSG
ncbi:sugar diacid recognition domain-containing protein [Sinomonas sp. JGH33]|uniref:Sugar diacid recognition domain-containing protein n=1 Tax=Sinomonas terricola TaxID=3110330 RepID=A0ABU5TAY8_9MICC|nr:sugar diacid recognition domain-containing protein [Sinomonas sp. JGH33]MEA5456847.1 sugar diacid recognition domain-containing protein [Sinomonas sp. JGH33]